MKINLRSFVYLDSSLVKDYLSQLGKGYYEKEQVSDSSSIRTVEQNNSSEFERLHAALREQGLEKVGIDSDESWSEIEAGDILELDMVINVNIINNFLSNPALRALIFANQQSDSPVQAQDMFTNDTTATAKLAANDIYSFLMSLQTASILKPEDLSGELTVLCKVHRKLKDGETQWALSIPNTFKKIIQKQANLGELKKVLDENGFESNDLEVQSPGAVLIPIAIYR